MKYVSQLTDKELREIYSLFLCDGGEIVSLEFARSDNDVDFYGIVKEPDTDNQIDPEDGFLELKDDYTLTDYTVAAYHHSGGACCQKRFREYMYKI